MTDRTTQPSLATPHTRLRRLRASRRGGIFFEMAICCGLLVLLLAAIAQTSVTFLSQQRAISVREIAAQEAANLLDQARSIDFDQLTAEQLNDQLKLDDSLVGLAGAQWDVRSQTEDGLTTKRLAVTVHWKDGGLDRELSLKMWRFAPAATKPDDAEA